MKIGYVSVECFSVIFRSRGVPIHSTECQCSESTVSCVTRGPSSASSSFVNFSFSRNTTTPSGSSLRASRFTNFGMFTVRSSSSVMPNFLAICRQASPKRSLSMWCVSIHSEIPFSPLPGSPKSFRYHVPSFSMRWADAVASPWRFLNFACLFSRQTRACGYRSRMMSSPPRVALSIFSFDTIILFLFCVPVSGSTPVSVCVLRFLLRRFAEPVSVFSVGRGSASALSLSLGSVLVPRLCPCFSPSGVPFVAVLQQPLYPLRRPPDRIGQHAR